MNTKRELAAIAVAAYLAISVLGDTHNHIMAAITYFLAAGNVVMVGTYLDRAEVQW
tara:strand:- start:50522 stop:50689 length:168 start_codon:yes stop_codon:yes gene_type:complete